MATDSLVETRGDAPSANPSGIGAAGLAENINTLIQPGIKDFINRNRKQF